MCGVRLEGGRWAQISGIGCCFDVGLVGLSRSSCDLLTYIHLFLLYVFLPAHLSVVRITEM